MNGSQIREKLHTGQRTYGTHIVSLMNPTAAAIASELTLDFAFFCTEHMPIDRTEVGMLCRFYAARGISPVVRVPSVDEASISMMLDGGAEGIVVPYVETVEQVQRAVAAAKYRPIKGELLQRAIANPSVLSKKTIDFLQRFNRDTYVIIGIESVAAIDNLEALVTAADVDGIFLGPHDITTSMGIPEEYDNPRFIDTIEDVIRRCRKLSVGVGLHTLLLQIDQPHLTRFFDAGMNWIINGSDVTVMRNEMNRQLAFLRSLGNDTTSEGTQQNQASRVVETCIT